MNKRVLVVEDELDMRIFLSTLLETGGYHALVSRNGREGFSLAKASRPDLVILDVMMPDEGGAVMYRMLKADEDLSSIPVLMLSAVPEKSFRHYLAMMNIRPENALPSPDVYIQKPPDADELLAAIRRLLAEAGSQNGPAASHKP